MPKSFAQDPLGTPGMDQVPSVGRYFGGPQIRESGLTATSRLIGDLVGLGIAVNDKVQDAEADKYAQQIKEAGEDVVLSPSEVSVVDERTNQVAKINQQHSQGRLSADRRDQEMRRLMKEAPEHLRPAITQKLRAMGIEDPSQALIRRKAAQEEAAIQAQIKFDNQMMTIGIESGDPNVYNTPGVPESGINRSRAVSAGLKRRQKEINRNVTLEALGQITGATGGGTGTAARGAGTSAIRVETAAKFDPIFSTLRTDFINAGIDSSADQLLTQSSAIVERLANPASNLSNTDIEAMVGQLHSNKNQLLSEIQSDLLKSGSMNSTEAATLKTELEGIFNEFVFDGSKDRIEEFQNKTLVMDAITRRDGRIMREKMPFLTAASRQSPELVKALVAKDFDKFIGNMDDAKNAIEKMHGSAFDPDQHTNSTVNSLATLHLDTIRERAKSGRSITTVNQANEVLNTGKAVIKATGGKFPDPFRDEATVDALASERHTTDLIAASQHGTASNEIVDYTYRTMMNSTNEIFKRITDKPGFGDDFDIIEKGGEFFLQEKAASGFEKQTPVPRIKMNPSVMIEVNKELKRANKYVRAARKLAPSVKAPVDNDMQVLRDRVGAIDFMLQSPVQSARELFGKPTFEGLTKEGEPTAEAIPNLMDALVQIESSGNPDAVSDKGARGLAQIMPSTAADPGFEMDPIDLDNSSPQEQVEWAEEYINRVQAKLNGNLTHALAAYNWGYGNIKRWIAKGADEAELPKETRDYLNKFRKAGVL